MAKKTGLFVRVPASIGNVGPGFDALGVALKIYLYIWMEASDEWQLEVHGASADEIPADLTNRVYTTMRTVARDLDYEPAPHRIEIHNEIPIKRGLGGSGAAVVAGIAIATALAGVEVSTSQFLRWATDIEGHADNVAPSLLGGLAAVYQDPDGVWHAHEARIPRNVFALVMWPPQEFSTEQMRSILPRVYERDVVTRQLQRVGAILAYWQKNDDVPPVGFFYDELHQPFRLKFMSKSAALIHRARDFGLPAMISGSGPTVVALTVDRERVHRYLEAIIHSGEYAEWRWRYVRVDRLGLVVREAPRFHKRRLVKELQLGFPMEPASLQTLVAQSEAE